MVSKNLQCRGRTSPRTSRLARQSDGRAGQRDRLVVGGVRQWPRMRRRGLLRTLTKTEQVPERKLCLGVPDSDNGSAEEAVYFSLVQRRSTPQPEAVALNRTGSAAPPG